MTDMPRVIFKETLSENPAQRVKEILDKIYSLKGREVSNETRYEFEYYLNDLLNYVTLIHSEIIPIYDCLPEDKLVYFFNEPIIRILGVQLLLDNNYAQGIDNDLMLFDISKYKRECMLNNQCLVYDFDENLEEGVVNEEMSDYKQLPAVYSKINKDVIANNCLLWGEKNG